MRSEVFVYLSIYGVYQRKYDYGQFMGLSSRGSCFQMLFLRLFGSCWLFGRCRGFGRHSPLSRRLHTGRDRGQLPRIGPSAGCRRKLQSFVAKQRLMILGWGRPQAEGILRSLRRIWSESGSRRGHHGVCDGVVVVEAGVRPIFSPFPSFLCSDFF